MLANELRKLPEKELLGKVEEIRKQLFESSFKATTEDVQNPHEVRELRKDIARIHEILQAKKDVATPKRTKLTRAQRVLQNLRKACTTAEAKKIAANLPKPKQAQKKTAKKAAVAAAPTNTAKAQAPAKSPATKAPVAEKKA